MLINFIENVSMRHRIIRNMQCDNQSRIFRLRARPTNFWRAFFLWYRLDSENVLLLQASSSGPSYIQLLVPYSQWKHVPREYWKQYVGGMNFQNQLSILCAVRWIPKQKIFRLTGIRTHYPQLGLPPRPDAVENRDFSYWLKFGSIERIFVNSPIANVRNHRCW